MNYKFGVDYYPEHWPKERWCEDVKLMKEMGIEIVRLGEFSWSKFEPRQDEYKFNWLDEAIAIIAEGGMKVILGTPTAAPPAWLIEKYPEILPMDENGIRKGFGGRHHDCQSNPVYRKKVKNLVTALAEHYCMNPHVAGWQIDNELGNSHEELCMCESCRSAFLDWLEKKYITIDRLNEAWGTSFWSQTYDNFNQIQAPRKTPTEHNPSLLLNWKRFCSDLVVDFAHTQTEIIRKICPNQFITHNCMGIHPKTDYFKLAEELDFVSNDQYPTGYYFENAQPPYELAAYLDFMRGLKDKNFWMMELISGATGGKLIGQMPKPGQLKLWTTQCIAHGADTIVYFRFRTCLFGTEQYWHGILPHNGKPGRRYRELRDTITQMKEIMDDIKGEVTRAEIAILFDYDQQWAFQIQPIHQELSYLLQLLKYYRGFYSENIPVDFTGKNSEWTDYKLLVAPLMLLIDNNYADKLIRYVRGGGNLLLTMRSGVKDMDNVCIGEGELPCLLEKLAGVSVEDYDCLIYGDKPAVKMRDKKEILKAAGKWTDILKLEGAEVLAEFTEGDLSGKPAVTVNTYGKGLVYYVATEPEEELIGLIISKLKEKCGLNSLGRVQEGVEIAGRRGKKKDYLFVMNHTGEEKCFTIEKDFVEVGKEKKEDREEYAIKPYESRIFGR